MRLIRLWLRIIFKPLIIRGKEVYLISSGWYFSMVNPSIPLTTPFMPYSFIDFIRGRVSNRHKILEFGSGYSTLFYGNLGADITTVEHNDIWAEKIKEKGRDNIHLIFIDDERLYPKVAMGMENMFDIIIIDGINRNECIYNSLSSLKTNGVIILDDSQRREYLEGINFLLDRGFRKIDFVGLVPQSMSGSQTSLFYQNNNCLGI